MFFIDVFICWIINILIRAHNKSVQNNVKTPTKDEWIIMNDFHADYEKDFKNGESHYDDFD